MSAGKGSSPRNCFSRQFKENYDLIFNKEQKYLCYTEYSATGEGILIGISVEIDKTIRGAKEKHFKSLGIDEYFLPACDCFPISNKENINKYLKRLFSNNLINLINDNPEKLFNGFDYFKFSFHSYL